MTRQSIIPLVAAALLAVTTAATAATVLKSPPWLSIESPVNPYDRETRGAAMVVHATFREGNTQLSDVSGTAEGIVNGSRRSLPLRFEATSHPNAYALRRQWPAEGTWLLKINLQST